MNFSPILGFVDVHAAVVPCELLSGLDALVLRRELGSAVRLEFLDMTGQLRDWYGRVGQHSRSLEVHPPELHWVRRGDDAGIGHLEPGHERRRHLSSVHGLLQRLVAPLEDDPEDHQQGEANPGNDRPDHPDEVGAGSLTRDEVTVDTTAVPRSGWGPSGAGSVRL